MEMWHKTKEGQIVEFTITTDPPEALFWMTHKVKLNDIHIITKMPAKDKTKVRREIYDDILARDKAAHPNTLSEKHKTSIRDNAKARRKQQEAG